MLGVRRLLPTKTMNNTPIEFAKTPVEAIAIHFGYSEEAAEAHYAAYLAADWKDYQIGEATYRGRTRVEALNRHEDATGHRPPLWAVVELY